MDVTYNVLEGTRQYFLGVPKHAQPDSTPEEGAPAQSGAPAPSSRPPSAAAAPAPTNPSTLNTLPTAAPPRPPSEPLEPEPHIIHKATVMREAAEKRREQPEPDDEEETADALSPPSHIIRRPSLRAQPSPAPAPAAPCPSPARPTPELPQPPPMAPEPHPEANPQYRSPIQRGPVPISRPPDPFAPSRPPDPYSPSRPPETYSRYHYDMNIHESGRNSHGPPVASPRPSAQPRYNPHQTYARLTNSHGLPQHATSRLRETPSHSPPTQRYVMSSIQPPPPHNDRVPPIHHPAVPAPQSLNSVDSRSSQLYTHLPRSREKSPYDPTSYYDRPNSLTERKYDHQQSYSAYRQTLPVSQPIHTRFDQQKHAALDVVAAHYATKPSDRTSAPSHSQQLDASRITRNVENRHTYFYPAPSTSSGYGPSASGSVPVPQNQSMQMRTTHRPVAPKNNYKLSPVRTAPKPGVINQQSRPKVSVTSLVNEINQNKQKRESPLDLSVKTVGNSADSSTTQDDYVTDTASIENKSLKILPRTLSSSRQTLPQATMSSHKVDFLPDFTQFNERSSNQSYSTPTQTSTTACHNDTYEVPRPELPFPIEPQHQFYHDRNKFSRQVRPDYASRINLSRSTGNDRHQTNRIRDDRNFIIEERKRPPSSIISHIPEKMVRYETWVSDGRIDRLSRLAREQNELISKPVYNYASYKHLEAYQIEQKRGMQHNAYNENVSSANRRYPPYPIERPPRASSDYHQYHDRNSTSNYNRNVIQKTSTHRDVNQHHVEVHDGVPADKRVLSILRNSLETKQTGLIEPVKSSKQMPDLIVIDDVDDSIIEITDDNETENQLKSTSKPLQNQMISTLNHNIQMPKAIDSMPRDTEIINFDSLDSKSKSPESDVASRIRTKAELKVMPPSQDNPMRNDIGQELQTDNDKVKLLPKSQKQHLFNQIREDNLRMESFIKTEKSCDAISEVKSEPMNIDEIEKDAEVPLTTEGIQESLEPKLLHKPEPEDKPSIDMDWDDACDSFMEQLKVGNHSKIVRKKRNDTLDIEAEIKVETQGKTKAVVVSAADNSNIDFDCPIVIKQEPLNDDITESKPESTPLTEKDKVETEKLEIKNDKKYKRDGENAKIKHLQSKNKSNSSKANYNALKKDENEPIKLVIKEESESTDDDEPLIKSKILKEKEHSERLKHQLLKDLSEKSAYVKLECFDIDIRNTRQSIESPSKEMDEKPSKSKISRQVSRNKTKTLSIESNRNEKERSDSSSDSDDDVSVASRLRTRKNIKIDENKSTNQKSVKTSPLKKLDSSSCSTNSTPIRKQGFGENSYFRPGWEEELVKYKRSLRMPTRLIAIPRCSSVRPFVRGSGALFSRGSTSLPDLDPAPLSPAPSSAPSAATDDLFARRADKLTLDSDLDSNSSCSVVNKLQYDSEASTSTVVSTSRVKKKGSSIVDLLMQKCGKKEESRKKSKDKEEKVSKHINNNANLIELLPTPSLEFTKNNNKKNMHNNKKKVLEDMLNLTTFKKQRATIKEVFGDERPASAPPSSHRGEDSTASPVKIAEIKPKVKSKKVIKGNKLHRRSSSTREGLRSDIIKRNDSKGRLLRLKKRNNVIKSLANKRIKESKIEKSSTPVEGSTSKQESCSIPPPETVTKRRFKRLFGKRKLSSGFDYIRKKKKIIRTENNNKKITRRPAIKPSPESVHDIQKEIKGWIINKSIGETYLHRAVRSGYTDCVAYCLEKMGADPSARDNAGYTPLHVAAAKGHVRIARLLLQYGADVSAAAHAGGIRPLHEACENCHVELIRLLLSYGADPLLMTYADQTPEDLADGPAALLLRLHIADVQGTAVEPWRFPPITEIIDREELGCDPLSSPPPASPPPPPDSTIEIQCTEAPLPPFYSLRPAPGQPSDGLWCLLQDITNLLQIKSKDSLLKQIHCGSGSPKELLREIRTQEFLERAQCQQLLCAGERVNVRASKVALVRVTDKLRQLLKVETILVS